MIAYVGMWAASIYGVKVIVDGVTAWAVSRQGRTSPTQLTEIAARLDQLTAAVEAIAIEQERQGEQQRFAAKLALEPGSARLVSEGETGRTRPLARPITPH